ncbi:MAG TPA: Crp/Fnr family transcriptional regulator [Fluviicoccus sp.]|nr:Crp/Fnr family transcriptional regulator [Fluviicoccus sp.]
MFDLRIFLEKTGDKKGEAAFVHYLGRKDMIFSQGDVADSVYYILRGKVKLTVVSALGKEAVIALLQRGAFFGEGCLAGQEIRMSTAEVLENATIIQIKTTAMIAMLRKEPEYSEMFMAHVLARSIRLEEDLVDHLFNTSEQRLARLLLLLAEYGSQAELQPIFPRFSQETMAEMIGSTRARVSSFMNKFRRLGLIDYRDDGGLIVHEGMIDIMMPIEPGMTKSAGAAVSRLPPVMSYPERCLMR